MRRETHATLRAFGQRVLKLVHQGRTTDLPVDTDQLGIDVLVRVLLERDEQAQERNRRRKRGKKKGRTDHAEYAPQGSEEGGEG